MKCSIELEGILEDKVLCALLFSLIGTVILAVIFCILDRVILFIISVSLVTVLGVLVTTWLYVTSKICHKIDLLCYIVGKNRIKFLELGSIFSMGFIKRIFDISESVTSDSIVEVYIYPNFTLYEVIRGRTKAGKIVNFGDNKDVVSIEK